MNTQVLKWQFICAETWSGG